MSKILLAVRLLIKYSEDNEEDEVADLERQRDLALGKIAESRTVLDSDIVHIEELRKIRDCVYVLVNQYFYEPKS